ncbi:MAG: hypothetical protein WC969_15375 [Elusimicrobiota bacterium]|jgi:hypothetical protein
MAKHHKERPPQEHPVEEKLEAPVEEKLEEPAEHPVEEKLEAAVEDKPAEQLVDEPEDQAPWGGLHDATDFIQGQQLSRQNACVLLEDVRSDLEELAKRPTPPGPYAPILLHFSDRLRIVFDVLQDKEANPVERTHLLRADLHEKLRPGAPQAVVDSRGPRCEVVHADGSRCELEVDATGIHRFAHKAGWRRW